MRTYAINGCKTAEEVETDKIDNLCNHVTFTTVSQLIKSHDGLHSVGFGGGGALGINILTIIFDYYKSIDIKNGRKLIVDCVEKFLININGDKELRPYLKIFPFLPTNIEIKIFVKESRDSHFVGLIAARDGNIEYYHYLENEERILLLEESYETALAIVKKESKK